METRQHIVEAADRLFYERGFDATSFSDIASAVKISRGNFYYHFKTKDDILDAVIDFRLAGTRAMLEAWQSESATPSEKIRRFIEILIANRAKIMLHGCPVGTLCSELAKLDHIAQDRANQVFTLFRDWLACAFAQLGRPEDADALALHLLARSQGVATLATAFRDEGFIRREVDDMRAWLATLAPAAPARTDARHT
ncbi:TetR family transcriptional regulator [Methylobacterium organophilum]|uniref:TetR/AcrR family transcriptional regulator n=1 Tax=Methylobacterium organophilum TaxID=410 RepID=UPI001F142324|nr:TetR/AcrR family transcriptional regulator [Methylobacterium organophilum]UMY16121.1 TetR family transcriptional regulator [Methylobacterium organophilum]